MGRRGARAGCVGLCGGTTEEDGGARATVLFGDALLGHQRGNRRLEGLPREIG